MQDWDAIIDQMLHDCNREGHGRSVGLSDNLTKIVLRMEHYQRELDIPDRDIKIVSYFARHPSAVIIPEKNVRAAFSSARRAMRL